MRFLYSLYYKKAKPTFWPGSSFYWSKVEVFIRHGQVVEVVCSKRRCRDFVNRNKTIKTSWSRSNFRQAFSIYLQAQTLKVSLKSLISLNCDSWLIYEDLLFLGDHGHIRSWLCEIGLQKQVLGNPIIISWKFQVDIFSLS